MDASSKRPVLELLDLTGEDNFYEWNDNLDDILDFYGLRELIYVPESPDHSIGVDHNDAIAGKKGFVLGLMAASIAPISDQLEKVGWDFKKTNQDPRELHGLIVQLFSPYASCLIIGSKIAALVEGLSKPQSGRTLIKWKLDIEYAKRQLSRQGAPISDTLATWLVLQALKDEDPARYRILLCEQYSGKLTWDLLMSKIEEEIQARRDFTLPTQ